MIKTSYLLLFSLLLLPLNTEIAQAELSYGNAKVREITNQADSDLMGGLARIRESYALISQGNPKEAQSKKEEALSLIARGADRMGTTRTLLSNRRLDLRPEGMTPDQQERSRFFQAIAQEAKLESPTQLQAFDLMMARLNELRQIIESFSPDELMSNEELQRVTYERILAIEKDLVAITFAIDQG